MNRSTQQFNARLFVQLVKSFCTQGDNSTHYNRRPVWHYRLFHSPSVLALETLITARENCFTFNKVRADGLDAALWLKLVFMCSKEAKFMCQTTVWSSMDLSGMWDWHCCFCCSLSVITFHLELQNTHGKQQQTHEIDILLTPFIDIERNCWMKKNLETCNWIYVLGKLKIKWNRYKCY